MTTLTHNDRLNAHAAPSLRGLAANWAATWTAFRAARNERRRITRELNAYTDRELAELGFFRSDISAIADGTYRR